MLNISNKNTEKLEQLYLLAEKNGIPIDENCPDDIISMSVKLPNGMRIIGFSKGNDQGYTRLEQMAHEMGHCMTDSFYEGYSPFELRARHEASANRWAVEEILPFSELCRAISQGYRELWELAEYFGVSEEFIKKAIALHESNGNTVPKELYVDM